MFSYYDDRMQAVLLYIKYDRGSAAALAMAVIAAFVVVTRKSGEQMYFSICVLKFVC